MKFQIIKLILLTLFSFHSMSSQIEWNSKKDKIIIPFELSNNLIIIDVLVNNVTLSMLLDTGSDLNVLFSYPENDSIEFFETRKIKLKGLGIGQTIDAYVSNKNKLQINEFTNNDFEVLLVTDSDIHIVNKLGLPINGIIGYSFFKDYLVEVNYQKQKIILHKNENILNKRKIKKYSKIKFDLINDKPYVSLNSKLDENSFKLKLLFDTGLGDGLWLFENDSINCSRKYFLDFLGRGLGGDIKGKRSRINKLSFSNYNFSQALVSFPDSLSLSQLDFVKKRNGSLGGELIKRFNWFINYQTQELFFKKNSYYNDSFNYNMSGIELHHNGIQWIKTTQRNYKLKNANSGKTHLNQLSSSDFIKSEEAIYFDVKYELKPVFEIYGIRENSPAYKVGLKVGDIILSINNKKAYQYSIQKITNLFQSEEGKEITIEVQREGQVLKFKFQLEKLL
ncbi:retropepsin-like aspartic protease [Flavobacterium sp. N2270]|uniref:retropepsin-like aspartic protease n=1 Tax=Flavobacterium sp. N2270 TaxID=2986831 RepID=UPI0022251D5D|nr:PDZ domain-containing protein [Flavobacterium sp. N2270]